MGKYLIVQFKRIGRLMPALLLVASLLLEGAYGAYRGLMHRWEQGEIFQKVQIGVVGTESDDLLRKAVDAFTAIDSSGFSLTFTQMSEQRAKSCLERGELSAYLVIPDGFLEAALEGRITSIRFVSVSGSENIFSMVKDELTYVVAEMLLLSEQGAFGLDMALTHYGHPDVSSEAMNRLALEYARKIIQRDEVYRVEEIGVWQGLSFTDNLICGLYTTFIFLLTLPFAAIFIRDHWDIEWMLQSQGVGIFKQVICQFIPYMVILTALCIPAFYLLGGSIRYLICGVFCIAALSYLIYSISTDLISGVMLQLVISLGLCFVCGCMYPVHFFPQVIQKLSAWLPAGMVRTHMTGAFVSGTAGNTGWMLFAFGTGMILLSVFIRRIRMIYAKGVRL